MWQNFIVVKKEEIENISKKINNNNKFIFKSHIKKKNIVY